MSSAPIRPLAIIALIALAFSAGAAEAGDPDTLAASGLTAMAEANQQPSRIIDAAMDFTAARKLYADKQDFAKVQEMNADIYWCKKRMNLDDLNAYLARKTEDPEAKARVAAMNAVVDEKVPAEQAPDYFGRAQKFAADNPDKHLQIAIRYYEIAERFQGTETSLKAQKLSLEEQQEYAKQIGAQAGAAAEATHRATLFTSPPVKAAGERSPLPGDADQRSAQADVHKVYKDELARKSPAQQRALSRKLIDEAASGKDEARLRWALIDEATNLAAQALDPQLIIAACDELAKEFDGVDAVAARRAAFQRMPRRDLSAAANKLLDDPTDLAANAVLGKHLCLALGAWDAGLPLASAGSDAAFKQVADMELAKPSGSAQEIELADKWYDLEGKNSAYKTAIFTRAVHWYIEAQGDASPIGKEKIKKRLEEMMDDVPIPGVDYTALTEAQWDHLRAHTVVISAKAKQVDSGVTLKEGQKAHIAPNPSDNWTASYGRSGVKQVDWHGDKDPPKSIGYAFGGGRGRRGAGGGGGIQQVPLEVNGLAPMALLCWLDDKSPQPPTVLTGPGHVYLGPNDPKSQIGAAGDIRVKILIFDEE